MTVNLSDPGMFPRTIEASSWEELQPLFEREGRCYTATLIYEGTKVIGWGSRELGEDSWTIRRRP